MIVILSTLDGKLRLAEMMAALQRVRIPFGTLIHVVDNGSQDGTLELLEEFAVRLPLVIHRQPVPGKNNCLNYVLDAVAATLDPNELVVFTDDDVLPCPEWLEELRAAGQAHPDCTVFAGRILPHWPCSGIAHLDSVRRHFGILFSITSNSEGPCEPVLAWGPNMAVRARVFQSGLRFDPLFGPNGGINYPMGSETELMERLQARGHRAWFVERACVRHMIRASQLEPQSILQRAFRHGYGYGWRRQRGGGGWRLVMAQWRALRGITSVRFRNYWSLSDDHLLQDFREAWARGLAAGAMYGYGQIRVDQEFGPALPERRSLVRTPLND